MTTGNEVREIDRTELSSEERSKLIAETSDVTSEETPNIVLKGSKETPEEFKEAFTFEHVEEGKGGTKGIPEPVGGGNGDAEPEPDAQKKEMAVIFKSLVEANPALGEKYKTIDEWIDGTKSAEPVIKSNAEPEPVQTVPVLSAEQREQIVLDKSYKFFSEDKSVKELLREIGMDKIPMEFKDWQELHRLDQEKNGNTFASQQVVSIFNKITANVDGQVTEILKTVGNRDKSFESATKEFVTQVEKTAKEIFPGIQAKDATPMQKTMKEFYNEATRFDPQTKQPIHPEYFRYENGIPIPDGKALYTNFIASNPRIIADIAKLGSAKNGKGPLRTELEKSKNGKSMTTLANQKHNTGSTKKVYLDNPKDRENLSSRERQAAIKALEEEIKHA